MSLLLFSGRWAQPTLGAATAIVYPLDFKKSPKKKESGVKPPHSKIAAQPR
jgi:hypothetical protein